MQEVVWALLLLSCELCCFTSGSVVPLPVFGLPSCVGFPCGEDFYVVLWWVLFGDSFSLLFWVTCTRAACFAFTCMSAFRPLSPLILFCM